MDTYSSGEDLLIKTRKPYTITKQRERWTEEEHNRFLEALKLYGRAWQRIEEHIGTKTAVQIRSHAQKFFSKLEKEAVAKGVPMGDLEIDIPPPRPKRKPSNPYPRKTGVSPTACHVAQKDGKLPNPVSLPHFKQVLDLEKEPLPEKPSGENDQPINAKGKEVNSSSEALTVLQDAHCSSVSSMNKSCLPSPEALRNPCFFREFIPPLKSGVHRDESTESHVTNSLEGNQNSDKPTEAKQTVKDNGTSFRQTPGDATFQGPRFYPVGEVNGHPSVNSTSVTADPKSSAQSFLNFPSPHFSSAFSNLIVSTLLQNPAAHAAATFAAAFWPYANVEINADSPGFMQRQPNSAPGMAAIAAATVAAATAWWAAHGLLPLCAPPAFACPPNSAPEITSANTAQDSPLQDQQLDLSKSEAVQAVNSVSKSPTLSLTDSEESGCPKNHTGPKAADNEKAEAKTEIHDLGKNSNRKQVDRSSCGSNTSGSEAETEALEKLQKDKEEFREADAIHAATRSRSNISDPRKEVSEEGRLAFRALFSREKLPQSFSPPHDQNNVDKQNDDNDETASPLNLNSATWLYRNKPETGNCTLPALDCKNNEDEEMLTIGLGHGKLKARRTGFKPYKRCSVEAKENSIQGEEKCPKRLRVEGEPSA